MSEVEIREDERRAIANWLVAYIYHLQQSALDSGDEKTSKHLGLGAAYVGTVMEVIVSSLHNAKPIFLPRTMGDVPQ